LILIQENKYLPIRDRLLRVIYKKEMRGNGGNAIYGYLRRNLNTDHLLP